MYPQIQKAISRYVAFTEEELNIFDSLLVYKKLPKKTIMLREGEKCNFEAFVLKGCVRKYYVNEHGAEVVIQFAIEDSWISDISFSIYETQPSHVFVETLEDSEFLIFSPETKELLFAQAPRFERAFRILIQRNLAVLQNRFFQSITNTAAEKYEEFLKLYPSIPQRVAQHYIASYLGISPEFLSKIRTRKFKS